MTMVGAQDGKLAARDSGCAPNHASGDHLAALTLH